MASPRSSTASSPSSSATHLAVPGAGLGLSITKTIVEEHGGRIAVSPKPI